MRRYLVHPAPFFLLLFIGCCPFLISRAAPLPGGLPLIRNISPAQYNAGIQNWDIAQGADGRLYIANNFGLLEYNGVNWQIHPVKNGTKVRAVSIMPDGRILVGSQGDFGYFSPDIKGVLQYVSLADSLPEETRNFDEAWRIYQQNNTVYFCTFSAIYIYRDGKFDVVKAENPLEPSFHVQNALFTVEVGKGLERLSNGRLLLVPGGEALAEASVSAMLPLNGQDILVTTFEKGIYLYDGHALEPWNVPYAAVLKNAIVNTATRLHDGSIAFGTQSDGIIITDVNGQLQLQLNKDQGLQSRTVLCLYQDFQQNLWAGMNNGISLIELATPFRLINEQAGLPGTGYDAYLRKDTLYLGTNNGLYKRWHENNQFYTRLVPNSRGQVYSIGEFGGELLMGHHTGAYRVTAQQAERLHTTGAWTFLPLTDHPGILLGGTYNGLTRFKRDESGHWLFNETLEGLDESSRVMKQGVDGTIWMTHGYRGAYKISLNATADSIVDLSFYNQDDGFPSNIQINVFRVQDQLVFTAEQGVFTYDEASNRFVVDSLMTNLLGPANHIQMLKEDALGNVYFIAGNEIGVLRKTAAGGYQKETSVFNRLLGLLNDDLENLTILEDQTVLFAAKEGFIWYNPQAPKQPNLPYATVIHQVRNTANDSLLYGGHLSKPPVPELAYSQNDLTFSFASTVYEAGSKPEFQYFLEPYEEKWSAWSTQSSKEYTNLPEGNYTFHVRSRNSQGEISPIKHYSFVIAPPWYRSKVAYTLYLLLFLGSLFFLWKLMDRRHKREKQWMAANQKAEISRREEQLQEVTRRSEAEISRLENEKLEAELVHKNQELATQTMYILSKNEFIGSLKQNLNSLSKKSKNKEVAGELKKITREIERNIDTDGDWDQFQHHFDQVHGDFLHRLQEVYPQLTPQEMKLCSYLRLNLSSKEIAQLLNISVRGVEISRYRLRKKLELQREDNLTDFILKF